MVSGGFCNPEVADGGSGNSHGQTQIHTEGFAEPLRFSASSAHLRLIQAFSSRTALGARRRRSPTPKALGANRRSSHRAIAICHGFHIVGTGRIWSDSAGFGRIFCFGSEPLWLIWLRFALSTYRTFSQYPVITYFVFLYLGSFRKKSFSHRYLSNSKCSFSYGKTMFPSFDHVHHLGSFCTLAIALAVAADVSRRRD